MPPKFRQPAKMPDATSRSLRWQGLVESCRGHGRAPAASICSSNHGKAPPPSGRNRRRGQRKAPKDPQAEDEAMDCWLRFASWDRCWQCGVFYTGKLTEAELLDLDVSMRRVQRSRAAESRRAQSIGDARYPVLTP